MSVPAEKKRYCKEDIKAMAVDWLARRGVSVADIAALVYEIQQQYIPGLTLNDCRESVERVLEKREVQNAVFTGLTLDMLAEQELVPEPLLGMLQRDDSLYGIDEILALSVVNIYGSIGLTNFGYLDKVKMGIIGLVNRHKGHQVNTFLDDIVAAIAAAAAARMAHRAKDMEEEGDAASTVEPL